MVNKAVAIWSNNRYYQMNIILLAVTTESWSKSVYYCVGFFYCAVIVLNIQKVSELLLSL